MKMYKVLLSVLGLSALLFLMVNALYIYPTADDFSYFTGKTKQSTWDFWVWHYQNWGGRYTANAILGLHSFEGSGLWVYRGVAMCVSLGLYASMMAFAKGIFRKEYFFVGNILFLCYQFSLFSIAQAYYWQPGALTYTLGITFSLLVWSLIPKIKETWALFLLVPMIFLANGTNEITALLLNASLCVVCIGWYGKEKRVPAALLFLLLFSMGCMLFSFIAPGNAVRGEQMSYPNAKKLSYSVGRTVWRSSIFFANNFYIYIIGIALMLWSLKGSTHIFNIKTYIPERFRRLVLGGIIVFPWVVLLVSVFPSYWATGGIPPERTANTIGFYFLVALLVSAIVLKESYFPNRENTEYAKGMMTVFIVLLLVVPNPFRDNATDFFSGRSSEYAEQMTKRIEKIHQNKGKNLVVEPLKVQPKTLITSELKQDSTHYFNRAFAEYYHLKTIRIGK